MHRLYAGTINETLKWLLQRKTRWILLFAGLIPLLSSCLLALISQSSGIDLLTGSDFPLTMLNLFTTLMLPLYLFMLAADTFPGELSSRTLKIMLVRPISRPKVFASKVLAIAAAIIVVLAIVWLFSVLAGGLLGSPGTSMGFFEGIIAYIVALFPMMAVGLFAVFIAQCIQSSTLTIVVSIIIYTAVKLLPIVFPEISVWSAFSYTDWHLLWIGGSASAGELLNVFVLLLSYSMIGYAISLFLFNKKEL